VAGPPVYVPIVAREHHRFIPLRPRRPHNPDKDPDELLVALPISSRCGLALREYAPKALDFTCDSPNMPWKTREFVRQGV